MKTGDNSGEHIYKTLDGIQSGPVALATSSSQIAFATIHSDSYIEDFLFHLQWKIRKAVQCVIESAIC